MTPDDIQVRRDICKDCTRECAVRATINHADPCQGCPQRVWHEHADCDHDDPDHLRGLGDVVAFVAQPIARAIDAATSHRTNVAGCGGCKARQAALNKAFPFTSVPPPKPPTS